MGKDSVFDGDKPVPNSNELLGSANITVGTKGSSVVNYLGIGATATEFDSLQKALKEQGFKEGSDFQIRPSSANGGNNVVSLSGEAAAKLNIIQALHKAKLEQQARQPAVPPPVDPSIESKKLLAAATVTNGTKGTTAITYLGVGATATEFDSLQKALKQQGFKEGTDFQIKPSSVNGGNNVISLSGDSASRLLIIQTQHQHQPPQPVKPAEAAPVTPQRKPLSADAAEQVQRFNSEHRLDESVRIAPGYKDGGRQAQYNDAGQTVIMASRETVTYKDPSADPTLQRTIDTAKRDMAGMTSVEQKAKYLNSLVAKLLHESDPDTNEKILHKIAPANGGRREVSLGQLIDAGTGVCRHRSLLFKVLADQTGVPAALVRGNFLSEGARGAHAWNEVKLENGKRLLVDVMHGHVSDMAHPYVRHYHDANKKPMYDENGPIQPANKVGVAQQDASSKKLLAEAPSIGTDKGTYLGVGASKAEFNAMQDALKQQGLKEGVDYHIKPSSLNGGNNVIALSAESSSKISGMQAELKIEPKIPPIAQAPATPLTPATPATPATPEKPARVTAESAMAASAELARQQLADPNYKPPSSSPASPSKPPTPAAKVDLDLSEPHHSTKISLGASGQKVDGHAGKAQLAVQVASEAAKGNYVAAATTAVVAIAEQQGIKFVAKRVPVVGGLITAGMTLWSAGAAAAEGNWKKAGSELVGGAAETVGNIVGFGAGDAAREAARKGLMAAGVKEENAPDKSGLRVAAETAYDMGKTITNAMQIKSMSKTDLAKTIQQDPALPSKLNLRGHEVTLVQAMEDKTFRATMIKNMEAEAKKNPELNVRVAALKEYGARLDAAAPAQTQQASAKPPTAPATQTATAAVTTPSAKPSPITPVVTDAQYKSMTTSQLASVIQKDPTLMDTVKIGKSEKLLSEALKDKDFRTAFLEGLEKAQANGTDLHTQIAMVKAYDTALSKPQSSSAPAVQMAAQQTQKVSAPAMA